ncbi:uncharacterized protein LOC119766060 [Culex quinquefasciatus]|uniref:uncharacterized protein LOC119766060 n=1 Tax=Culex quinquefasciatus TaxID=7176 RepID=UPI0018E29DB2|nr:uncharacterized protein LOC119766060 [Culex quinquefasciatus]
MPESNIFRTTNPVQVLNNINNYPVGRNVYVCMAQPLEAGSPSFCLQYFCSDNKFTAKQVTTRWKHYREVMDKEGIIIVGHASDGDPRPIGSMLDGMEMPSSSNSTYGDDYCATALPERVYMQDYTHGVNKLKVKILKKDVELLLGKFKISRLHLETLLANVHKSVHGLSPADLNDGDKMKFQPALRMSKQCVIDALRAHVPESNATALYLTMMKDIVDTFITRTELCPVQNVFKIWHVLFILRAWRNMCMRKYNGIKNTITTNTYWSVELMAHSLINYIAQCREKGLPYLPELIQSQTCESFFRSARSLSTTESTVINFTMKGFESKINLIQAKTEIAHDASNGFVFPV